jgi:hypothetical protein
MNDLGYFKDYGFLIIFFCIIFYMSTYIFLAQEYGEIDNDEWGIPQTFPKEFSFYRMFNNWFNDF